MTTKQVRNDKTKINEKWKEKVTTKTQFANFPLQSKIKI